ncbi:GNAT family N-acetyltransferase [Actinoplanes sp. NPDC026623]|uniref:GNAT family N-acetyltransferase n=1 Tax=Actinoplanes sp. NPDC026623 TaxID=3155610 RepID=UPI0033E19ADA
MRIVAMNDHVIAGIEDLMGMGAPYVRARSSSDYWLYATLFSSTCPVAIDGDQILGAVVAMRSQDEPNDVYIQDVMTHPEHRRSGVAQALLGFVIAQAIAWKCRRLYLTSEADNDAAASTWQRLKFTNIPGDRMVNGVHVISNFKGPGKDRAVYELTL